MTGPLEGPAARTRVPTATGARGLATEGRAKSALSIEDSVEKLRGVGPKGAAALAARGITSLADLLRVMPLKYLSELEVRPLGSLPSGEHCVVVGRVCRSVPVRFGGRARFELTVESAPEDPKPHGSVRAVWFFLGYGFEKRFRVGSRVELRGVVTEHRGAPTMVHPDARVLEDGEQPELGVRPVYERIGTLQPRVVARVVQGAVAKYAALLPESVPSHVSATLGLPSLAEALRTAHGPSAEDLRRGGNGEGASALEGAMMRLRFDRIFALEIALALRNRDERKRGALPIPKALSAATRARDLFPFALTHAQLRSANEILADLERDVPMRRLLQGDVGTGKTAVAALAALAVAEAGMQTAVLVPTEVLAEQHFRVMSVALGKVGVGVEIIVGSQKKADRRAREARVRDGTVSVVIGTHALLGKGRDGGVKFSSLGLSIVDEQHRFGVGQRLRLAAPGESERFPHLLLMTATPIPRSLALAQYGDVDISKVDEAPPGRLPVLTRLYSKAERPKAIRQVARALEAGGRAFVVCPSIDADDAALELASVEATSAEMIERFGAARVVTMHGGSSSAHRKDAMDRLVRGDARVLVSTTVIEVGVDVPEANVILVENAERFGLAQLHQLRGRVGRGGKQSACLLVTGLESVTARERLEVLVETNDGFRVAEADLATRGEGDLLGHAQSGFATGHGAELPAALIEKAKHEALAVLEADPDLADPSHRALRRDAHRMLGSLVGGEAG